MLNFVTDLDRERDHHTRGTTPVVAPSVRVTTTVRRAPGGRTDLLSDPASWDAAQLRDYLVRRITEIHGPFPREAVKETAIVRGFLARWGEMAGPIAVHVMETRSGMWNNAPVGIGRFCKASDDYFARPVAERLRA